MPQEEHTIIVDSNRPHLWAMNDEELALCQAAKGLLDACKTVEENLRLAGVMGKSQRILQSAIAKAKRE